MKKWKMPPDIKIYEALSAVASGRVVPVGNRARVASTSGNKHYEVVFDVEHHAITSNDNGSFYRGYLGYPSIAFLMFAGMVPYNAELAAFLKGVHWKDVNTKYKNDYNKALEDVLGEVPDETRAALTAYVHEAQECIKKLDLAQFETRQKPPSGY